MFEPIKADVGDKVLVHQNTLIRDYDIVVGTVIRRTKTQVTVKYATSSINVFRVKDGTHFNGGIHPSLWIKDCTADELAEAEAEIAFHYDQQFLRHTVWSNLDRGFVREVAELVRMKIKERDGE